MKRLATVLSPLTLLAIFVIGAAPTGKKPVAVDDPSPFESTSPTATAAITTPQLTTPIDQIETPAIAPHAEAAASMANYAIDWYSINGGGTVNASSTNYRMGASIGQSVAGAASSPSYQMGIGFWYGAGSGGCACDCHGNPVCDAAICDVLDVVSTVNVAFRNGAAIVDPNASCPYEATDVNCSTFTDVIDVVKIVNVAFRNGNPATEFCNPCP
jgi:hypothetical protein